VRGRVILGNSEGPKCRIFAWIDDPVDSVLRIYSLWAAEISAVPCNVHCRKERRSYAKCTLRHEHRDHALADSLLAIDGFVCLNG